MRRNVHSNVQHLLQCPLAIDSGKRSGSQGLNARSVPNLESCSKDKLTRDPQVNTISVDLFETHEVKRLSQAR